MLFFVLTVFFCFPLVLHPAGHLAEEPMGDKGTNLWNLWWVYYALFHLHQSPLWSDFVFYPWGCDLRFHTLSLANGIIALPVTALFGPVVAYNFLFFLWTWLTGVFASLWTKKWGLSTYGSVFLGFMAAFGPYRWSHQIHLNLFSTAWLFITFYFVECYLEKESKRDLFLLSLSWIITALTDWYYGIFAGLYYGTRAFIWVVYKERKNLHQWIEIGVPVFVLLLTVWGILSLPSKTGFSNQFLDAVDIRYSSFWSLDIMHLLIPVWLIRLSGMPVETGPEFQFHPGMLVFCFCLFFIFYQWKKNTAEKGKKIALLLLIGGFFIFSLGPLLKAGGNAMLVPLPALAINLIPYLSLFRVYTRFAYLGFLFFSLLGILGFECWYFSGKKRLIPTAILYSMVSIIFLWETGWRPLLAVPYLVPAEINQITKGPVLEVPYTPTRLSGMHLFHQTLHHFPLFVAEFSRLSGYKSAYLKKYFILDTINDIANVNQLVTKEPEDRFYNDMKEAGIGALVVNVSRISIPENAVQILKRVADVNGFSLLFLK